MLPLPDTHAHRELLALVASVRASPKDQRGQTAAIMCDWFEERGLGLEEVLELVEPHFEEKAQKPLLEEEEPFAAEVFFGVCLNQEDSSLE